MKLYTRSGDDGTTGLFGGSRVDKDDPRVDAYGSVDELNAHLGLARAVATSSETDQRLDAILEVLQSRLFDLGADLATPPGSAHEDKIRRIADADVAQAEAWIDEVDSQNEPMTSFVLPGGCERAARLHIARTACRRAERRVITLARAQPVGEPAVRYLNRISDLLFAMARLANKSAGIPDTPWTGPETG